MQGIYSKRGDNETIVVFWITNTSWRGRGAFIWINLNIYIIYQIGFPMMRQF